MQRKRKRVKEAKKINKGGGEASGYVYLWTLLSSRSERESVSFVHTACSLPLGLRHCPHLLAGGSFMTAEATPPPPPKRRGGRPKSDPAAVRAATIGVRVSAAEYAALRAKAEQMGITPAQFLRDAALKRRLPSPPVPAVNRAEYAELARLAANLNQLTRAANEGRPVTVAEALLERLAGEVSRLRLALLGVEGEA